MGAGVWMGLYVRIMLQGLVKVSKILAGGVVRVCVVRVELVVFFVGFSV